ncbi:MAG: hypothetical protein ACE5GK_10740 [Nitrospiria bacterium]
MKRKDTQIIFLAIMALFYFMTLLPLQSIAAPSQIEVIIKVNEQGFFDAHGKSFNNIIEVPHEQTIRLTFEHIGKPGEKHAFVLLFDSDEEIESGTISDLNKQTHIEFKTGEAGELYDVFCVIVECDGMEHLTDLVIEAI